MIETMKYSPHKFAKLVPEPSAAELEELTQDIADNGLREPVVLFEEQVLDGRSRMRACHKAGSSYKLESLTPRRTGRTRSRS